MPSRFEPEDNFDFKLDVPQDDETMWELLSLYVDGEATAEQALLVEAMLNTDPAYARDYAFLRGTSDVVRNIVEIEPPVGLRDSILAATSHRPTLARRLSAAWSRLNAALTPQPVRFGLAGGGLALAAGFAGFFWISLSKTVAPSHERTQEIAATHVPGGLQARPLSNNNSETDLPGESDGWSNRPSVSTDDLLGKNSEMSGRKPAIDARAENTNHKPTTIIETPTSSPVHSMSADKTKSQLDSKHSVAIGDTIHLVPATYKDASSPDKKTLKNVSASNLPKGRSKDGGYAKKQHPAQPGKKPETSQDGVMIAAGYHNTYGKIPGMDRENQRMPMSDGGMTVGDDPLGKDVSVAEDMMPSSTGDHGMGSSEATAASTETTTAKRALISTRVNLSRLPPEARRLSMADMKSELDARARRKTEESLANGQSDEAKLKITITKF